MSLGASSEMWKLSSLPKILKSLASIKQVEIGSLKIFLEGVHWVFFWKNSKGILETACKIINEKFPFDSKIDLIDENSQLVVTKKKFEKAVIILLSEYD